LRISASVSSVPFHCPGLKSLAAGRSEDRHLDFLAFRQIDLFQSFDDAAFGAGTDEALQMTLP
jgi:hypothetical protein